MGSRPALVAPAPGLPDGRPEVSGQALEGLGFTLFRACPALQLLTGPAPPQPLVDCEPHRALVAVEDLDRTLPRGTLEAAQRRRPSHGRRRSPASAAAFLINPGSRPARSSSGEFRCCPGGQRVDHLTQSAKLRDVQVNVALLGGLAVSVDGEPIEPTAWKSRRSAQLVALLALKPNHRLTTEQAMDASLARSRAGGGAGRPPQDRHPRPPGDGIEGGGRGPGRRGEALRPSPTSPDRPGGVGGRAGGRFEVCRARRPAPRPPPGASPGELLPEERYEEWTVGPRERALRLYSTCCGPAAGGLSSRRRSHRRRRPPGADGRALPGRTPARRHPAVPASPNDPRPRLGVLPSPQTVALYRRIVGTASAGWVRPGLVGREDELVRARTALRRAAEGRPSAVFVTGPAGIGKTRVCEELVEQATGDGWLVLRAAGREQTASVPYWALVEAVQAVMVERPYLANALGDAERALLARLTGVAPDHQAAPIHRHAVLHLLSDVVIAAAATRTMLVVDDLQHVDDDTLALADVVASAMAPRNVMLVASYREASDERVATLTRSMVARGIEVEIALRALSRAETDAMVRDVLHRAASEAELDLVWQLSEGSPFFALEVATALSSDGASDSGAFGAVDVRLERLPASTLAVLRSVATVEQEFTADELAALAGVDSDRGPRPSRPGCRSACWPGRGAATASATTSYASG